MSAVGDSRIDGVLQELAEIGVGATILGLRQINISRRRLLEQRPELTPAVDVLLDQVEAWAGPASSLVGGSVEFVASTVPGDTGERLRDAGGVITRMGPELLRLSGLTRRG